MHIKKTQNCEIIERPRIQFAIFLPNDESNCGCALVILPGVWNCRMRHLEVGECT